MRWYYAAKIWQCKGRFSKDQGEILEEILSIRKGIVKCGTPGLRYFVKTQGKETELLFDNTEKSWTVIIHDPQVYGETDGPQRVLEELKYLNWEITKAALKGRLNLCLKCVSCACLICVLSCHFYLFLLSLKIVETRIDTWFSCFEIIS